jgi:hypothetical protein
MEIFPCASPVNPRPFFIFITLKAYPEMLFNQVAQRRAEPSGNSSSKKTGRDQMDERLRKTRAEKEGGLTEHTEGGAGSNPCFVELISAEHQAVVGVMNYGISIRFQAG